MAKNKIPNNIKNGYPNKCPKCKKSCIAVFRLWKTNTRRVSCEIDASIPTLNQIFDAVQEEFSQIMPGRLLDERTNDNLFVKYRGIYYTVARYFKYSLHSMCLLTNQHHATVLHNLRNIPENSELKNKIIQKLKTINY